METTIMGYMGISEGCNYLGTLRGIKVIVSNQIQKRGHMQLCPCFGSIPLRVASIQQGI